MAHSISAQTVSHYLVIEKLGIGGMGVVHKAEDTGLHSVNLRFLPDEFIRGLQAFARFRREAQAASALNHSNICRIHDIREQDGQAMTLMNMVIEEEVWHLAGERHEQHPERRAHSWGKEDDIIQRQKANGKRKRVDSRQSSPVRLSAAASE